MKKLLAAVAVLAPAIALLPAAPASADSVCLPITVDGQPVCQDLTPVEQAVADAQSTVGAAADEALTLVLTAEGLAVDAVRSVAAPEYDGISYCDRATEVSDGVVVTIGSYWPSPPSRPDIAPECVGWELRIEASPGTGVTPVHIPQVCVTTTGTCVGGIDTSVPTPAPSYTVCLRSYSEAFFSDGRSIGRDYDQSGSPTAGICLPAV